MNNFRIGRRFKVILILSCVARGFIGSVVSYFYSDFIEDMNRHSCSLNLKQQWIFSAMYAGERGGGFFPILSSESGRLMIMRDSVPSDFYHQLGAFFCPSDEHGELLNRAITDPKPEHIDDYSYLYLGYALTNDAEVEAFAEAYREQISKGGNFEEDLKVPKGKGTYGGDTLFRLRDEEEMKSVISGRTQKEVDVSTIPLFIERVENHVRKIGNTSGGAGGAWVLYLGGVREYIPYPGKWPMTEKTIGILEKLDELGE